MRRKFIEEPIFSYCNGDYDLLNEQILENSFDTYCWSNVNEILNHWYNWLSSLIKKCIPKRTKHRSSLPQWISQSTSNLIKLLHTAQKIYRVSTKSFALKWTKPIMNSLMSQKYSLYTVKLFISQAY